jgi:hypothetical protein
MNVLTKGFELNIADKCITWNETCNIKNYNAAFINLHDLFQNPKYYHPAEKEEPRQLQFPNAADIVQLIRGEGSIFVIMPPEPHIEVFVTARQGPDSIDLDLFYWLPFEPLIETRGGSSIDWNHWEWDWYFNDNFSYDMYVVRTEQMPIIRSWESDPNEVYKLTTKKDDSPQFLPQLDSIAKNPANEAVASRVQLFTKEEVADAQGSYSSLPDMNGGVYFIPLKENQTTQEFASDLLQNIYSYGAEEGAAAPDWIDDYMLPHEIEIRDEIQELLEEKERLESKLKKHMKYRRLLFQKGDSLEEIVRESLSEIGFEIEGEIPGKRDGLIHFPDSEVVIEIHGTTSNLGKNKCRQLSEWVSNVRMENPDSSVEGLLIANPQRNKRPEEREDEILSHEQRTFMEQESLKAISTISLYKIIYAYRNDGFDKGQFIDQFHDSDVVLTFESIQNAPIDEPI